MEDEAGTRAQQLLDAGFEIKFPLPSEYADVLEGLDDDQIAVLVEVKRRLDEAEKATAPAVGPYRVYVVPF
jgi:hypothetical protein